MLGTGFTRNRTRRTLLKSLGLGTVALVLAACTPKATPTPEKTAAPTQAPAATQVPAATAAATKAAAATPAAKAQVTLRFHGRSGAQGDYFTKQAEEFNKTRTDVKMTTEELPTAEYDQKLSTLLAGGELRDGYHNYPFGIYDPFAARGVALDLLPLVDKDKLDLKVFFPATVEQLKWEGKLAGWPQGAHPGWTTQFTNVTAWQEAGAQLPQWGWSFEKEWLEAVKKVTLDTNKDGTPERYGFQFDYVAQGAYTFIKCWGGDWLDPQTRKKSGLLEEKASAGLLFMWDLVYKHKVSPTQKSVVANMLANGLSTAWTGNVASLASVRSAVGTKFKMQAFPMSSGPGGRGSFVGIDTLCIHKATKVPEAVFEYIKFLTTKENNLLQMDAGFAPPVRYDSWKDPKLANDTDQLAAFQ